VIASAIVSFVCVLIIAAVVLGTVAYLSTTDTHTEPASRLDHADRACECEDGQCIGCMLDGGAR